MSIQHLYDGSVDACSTGNTLWNQVQSTFNLNIGVPHRSILGPLFFLINNNDIVNLSNVLSFIRFADNTMVNVQNDSIDGAKLAFFIVCLQCTFEKKNLEFHGKFLFIILHFYVMHDILK